MKIAVLGPIVKDYVTVDNHSELQIGGCSYYVANALHKLGADVTPFITFSKEYKDWVEENFQGIRIEHIEVDNTMEFYAEYSSCDPDKRTTKAKYYSNIIKPTKELLNKLEEFDYIVIVSLFYDNTPKELFEKLKHKNLVSGNFGMFSYPDGERLVWKNPENLIEILPYLKYLFLDINEARYISSKDKLKDVGRFFIDYGLDNMIITEGSKGSNLFTRDEYYKIPAYPPKKLVDPTGAGDTYLAAFIRGFELYSNVEEVGRFAAMTATVSLENRGAFCGQLSDVLSRLEE